MDFTVDFFRDEVRNGFYIPTAIKQGWAAGLVVLDEIDRICRKHDINYCADWGTFLGAVRHGGFVPWDDDLDICMKREDYDKFRSVADLELPKEFVIHDYERKEAHNLFLVRIVNNSQICFEDEHLKKYHNFPYMSSVDIFVLDYLYNDEEKERSRCDEIKRLIAVADGILDGTLSKDAVNRELFFFEKKYNVKIDRKLDNRHIMIELYKLAEKQMACAPKEEAKRIGQIFPWVLKGSKGHPRKYYDNLVRVPFENTTIPVPMEYNKALQNHYGKYLVCRKVWNGHDYPYFEKQRENLQAVADFKLPEFTFSNEMLIRPDSRNSMDGSLKGMVLECIKQIGILINQLDSSSDDIIVSLSECQQLLVDMGTLIENVKGEDSSKPIIEIIQNFCDELFDLYNLITTHNSGNSELTNSKDKSFSYGEKLIYKIGIIKKCFKETTEIIEKHIINREEILFLTIGPKEWNGFKNLYEQLLMEDRADICVVPLPLLFKDYVGQIYASDDEIIANTHLDDYPENVKLSLWTDYNLALHHPEKIYIQSPYDGENPCLTVPPNYYAKDLRNYTERLIYIPPFKTDEFKEKDYTDFYNLKHYVTAPGVIYSDEVIVQSDNIREQYIKKLISFSGGETKDAWIKKIKVDNQQIKGSGKRTEKKKKIFYLIGLNELSENNKTNAEAVISDSSKDNIIEKIKLRIELFNKNKEDVETMVGFYPPDLNTWNNVSSRKTKELTDLLSSYGYEYIMPELDNTELEKIVAEYDAYYGSPSPLVTIFSYNKKPVMIADYDI